MLSDHKDETERKETQLADLPIELGAHILSNLPPLQILRTAGTCKFFRDAANSNLLWEKKCNQFNLPAPKTQEEASDYKSHLIKNMKSTYTIYANQLYYIVGECVEKCAPQVVTHRKKLAQTASALFPAKVRIFRDEDEAGDYGYLTQLMNAKAKVPFTHVTIYCVYFSKAFFARAEQIVTRSIIGNMAKQVLFCFDGKNKDIFAEKLRREGIKMELLSLSYCKTNRAALKQNIQPPLPLLTHEENQEPHPKHSCLTM